ncbi:hypothetical protein [Mucilaginibacter pedocola]|uniref:hypothetical protein n=1 Tax=Mucilaginibacter pedocola TaxID=1792845 RepID=UPI0012DF23D4|nr:hypothetical protein [Mucilaginibacter pedocola]
MQEPKNKLPKKQAVALYQFLPMNGLPQPTSNDPTSTSMTTVLTTTHIFKG